MRSGWRAAAFAVALGMGGVVHAHDFVCEKLANGQSVFEIDHYPAHIHWDFTVANSHPTLPSTAQSVEDALLKPYGFVFTPAAPFTLPVGGVTRMGFDLTIRNAEECRELDEADGVADGQIDNTLVVTFDDRSTTCSARVICKEEKPPHGECGGSGGATRGLGFWKNHMNAVQACMAAGPVDLGIVTVRTLADFEGILWGSPARFEDRTKRSDLDQARFILARELLVAECNVRVFNARPVDPNLFQEAVQVITSTDCGAIRAFVPKVHGFNDCDGDKPHGSWGPADPKAAQAVADDPTVNSGQSCK